MTHIEFSAAALSTSRFAVSPAFELDSLLRVLQGRVRRTPATAWANQQRDSFASLRSDPAFRAVLALQSSGFGVDFLCPRPQGQGQSWEMDLNCIQHTSADTAHDQIAEALRGRNAPASATLAVLSSPDVVQRLAAALDTAWHTLLAEAWPAIRAICERDVLHRVHIVGTAGWNAALNDLHHRLVWANGELAIGDSRRERHQTNRGMLLVPSVFIAPSLAVRDLQNDDPAALTLVYPARGAANLVSESAPRRDQLSALIGKTRAELLQVLVEAASTTHLAHRLQMSPGAISDHLAILHDASMLTKARAGRSVLYQRSPIGDAIVGESRSPS